MNNNNILCAMDHLSKIFGYTAPESSNAVTEDDLYTAAAQKIQEHIQTSGYSYDATSEVLDELYEAFRTQFSPEALQSIPDSDLLRRMFYTAESTNDSMCYWLEFHPQLREHFGSIAGGSSYKFGLFQKRENGIWIGGSPQKPVELSEEQAFERGKEIRDMLIKGAAIIRSMKAMDTIESYEKLDTALNAGIGKYAAIGWVHKYYHMIFPDLFPIWHAPDWQKHFLYAFGIVPGEKWYVRSGQLVRIAKAAALSNVVFGHAIYDLFGEIKRFCRIGISHDQHNFAQAWRDRGIVAIGWPAAGKLTDYRRGDSINHSALQAALVSAYYGEDIRTASRKAREIGTFILSDKDTVFVAMDGEQLLALCDEVGDYFMDEGRELPNCKPVVWHNRFADSDRLPNKNEGLRTTCVLFKDAQNLIYLYDKYYSTADIENTVAEKEPEMEHKPRVNPLFPLNQIIYGAPGTGKTYSAVEYAVAIIDNEKLELSSTPEQRKAAVEKYQSYINSGQIVFTAFHQNYGYEEFIQGIRPYPTGDKISFRITDGIFKKFADEARKHPCKNYVIIIDEINRGNISKIFGELITLIESDKRLGEPNQMSVTLPLGATFSVPNNLYMIGTMNTADKSISLIDVALRRRFEFIGMYPNLRVIKDETVRQMVAALNKHLRTELRGSDLLIGHSFFIDKKVSDIGDIMNKNIIPLLYEYFFDEEPKIKKALECLVGTGYTVDDEFEGRIQIKKVSDD